MSKIECECKKSFVEIDDGESFNGYHFFVLERKRDEYRKEFCNNKN